MEKDRLNGPKKLVIIAGSAGSLTIIFQILPHLQRLKNYAILLVIHRKSTSNSSLVDLLNVKSKTPIIEIEDKQSICNGFIYLAPADYHLLIENRSLFSLDISEKINYSRPSIDVAFESAADVFNIDSIGILLSGANEDGSQGLEAIQKKGGYTIVQNPESAQMPVMPISAIERNAFDIILNPPEILHFLNQMNEI